MCVHEELWFQPPSPCPFVFSFPVLRSHPANARILFFRGDTLRDAHMLIESQETHVPISLSRYKFGWTLEEREKKKEDATKSRVLWCALVKSIKRSGLE